MLNSAPLDRPSVRTSRRNPRRAGLAGERGGRANELARRVAENGVASWSKKKKKKRMGERKKGVVKKRQMGVGRWRPHAPLSIPAPRNIHVELTSAYDDFCPLILFFFVLFFCFYPFIHLLIAGEEE